MTVNETLKFSGETVYVVLLNRGKAAPLPVAVCHALLEIGKIAVFGHLGGIHVITHVGKVNLFLARFHVFFIVEVLGVAEFIASLGAVETGNIGAGALVSKAARLGDTRRSAVGKLHQEILVDVTVIPLVLTLAKRLVARPFGASEARHLGGVGIHGGKHHSSRVGGIKKGRHSALGGTLSVRNRINVMIILGGGIGEVTEFAVLKCLAAEHRARIVVAGLANHVGELLLSYQLYDAAALLHGRGHGNGRINILTCLKRTDNNVAVQMTLGEVRDTVNVLARQCLLVAVEYFVSYYDYYQPEAYIPGKDMYIEKDAQINDEIDMLRHSATSALLERRDVIIVASVSCIYSLGDPEEYKKLVLAVRPGMLMSRDEFVRHLIAIQYDRNDVNFVRDKFRVHGDTVDVFPASNSDKAIRVEFWGDEIERISEVNVVTGEMVRVLSYAAIYPASHYAVSDEKREEALKEIEQEMKERAAFFRSEDRLIEAQRIEERVKYDLEMLREVGFCSGVENYSRVLARRPKGSTPYTLLDYFPEDFVLFVDESHMTLPQVKGMSGGDKARKTNLVEYGFRLPSAFDNRPLFFEEFESKLNQVVCVSATPGEYEVEHSSRIVEQIIRPTGLLDPLIEVRPIAGQVDDLLGEIRARAARNERVLVTTLTRKMAEDLTDHFEAQGVKVKYIHYNVQTIERMEIIRDLRLGTFDVLIGINLLREGLDIPEVSLVAILDADKEGFLRAERGLIQTVGRAARNADGRVIMYADHVTESMRRAITETERRRSIQHQFNVDHGITPKTITKGIRDVIEIGIQGDIADNPRIKAKAKAGKLTQKEKEKLIIELTAKMKDCAKRLDFEQAVYYRDKIKSLSETK